MKTKITTSAATSVALVLLIAIVNGCTIAKISGRGAMPMMLNTPPQRVKVIERFDESKMITFDYTSSFDVSEIIGAKLQRSDADAITNLVIEVKGDFPSFLLNLVTLGLANAKVFSVEGELVKIEGGMSSLLESYEVVATFDNLDQFNLESTAAQNTSLVRLDEGFALVRQK